MKNNTQEKVLNVAVSAFIVVNAVLLMLQKMPKVTGSLMAGGLSLQQLLLGLKEYREHRRKQAAVSFIASGFMLLCVAAVWLLGAY